MTLNEKYMADSANSNLKELAEGFTNTFRAGQRESIKEGEILTIPENYKVYENRQLGSEGKHPQYINCPTNLGRIVEFYPSMLTRAAFVVDDNCQPVLENNRQKRVPTGGSVAAYVAGKAINPTMQAMQGCQIQFHNSQSYKTRAFGVPAAEATKKDVVTLTVGDWDFVGEKFPEGYVKP